VEKNNYFEGLSANRYQWGGSVDAPRTYILSLTGPLNINTWESADNYLQTSSDLPVAQELIFLTRINIPLTDKLKLSLDFPREFTIHGGRTKINLHDNGDLVLTNALQACSLLISVAGFFYTAKNSGLDFPACKFNKTN